MELAFVFIEHIPIKEEMREETSSESVFQNPLLIIVVFVSRKDLESVAIY